jgi:hypothetical protein
MNLTSSIAFQLRMNTSHQRKPWRVTMRRAMEAKLKKIAGLRGKETTRIKPGKASLAQVVMTSQQPDKSHKILLATFNAIQNVKMGRMGACFHSYLTHSSPIDWPFISL